MTTHWNYRPQSKLRLPPSNWGRRFYFLSMTTRWNHSFSISAPSAPVPLVCTTATAYLRTRRNYSFSIKVPFPMVCGNATAYQWQRAGNCRPPFLRSSADHPTEWCRRDPRIVAARILLKKKGKCLHVLFGVFIIENVDMGIDFDSSSIPFCKNCLEGERGDIYKMEKGAQYRLEVLEGDQKKREITKEEQNNRSRLLICYLFSSISFPFSLARGWKSDKATYISDERMRLGVCGREDKDKEKCKGIFSTHIQHFPRPPSWYWQWVGWRGHPHSLASNPLASRSNSTEGGGGGRGRGITRTLTFSTFLVLPVGISNELVDEVICTHSRRVHSLLDRTQRLQLRLQISNM